MSKGRETTQLNNTLFPSFLLPARVNRKRSVSFEAQQPPPHIKTDAEEDDEGEGEEEEERARKTLRHRMAREAA